MLFRNILFPVDFSKSCERIVPSVAAMREAMGAKLALLHSIDLPCDWPAQDAAREWLNFDSLRACDYDRLAQFGAKHFRSGKPDLIQESGGAADAILRCVKERHADLIMMPTHGYGLFRRTLIGSVTTKVLRHAKCAVWTASQERAIASPVCQQVLCAIDDPLHTRGLLRSAAEIADAFGARLSIVHAYSDVPGAAARSRERSVSTRAELMTRRRLDSLQKAAGTRVDVVIARGEVNEVIAETAQRRKADLVITGRGMFGGFLLSLHSHLYYIIRSSPCPVLVLSDGEIPNAPVRGAAGRLRLGTRF